MSIVKRVVGSVSVLVAGPVLGTVIGSTVAAFRLPPDPTGRGSPGDGFLIILYGGAGAMFGALASVIAAVIVVFLGWRTKGKQQEDVPL